jgi:2-amino-4-hydroxy-6-hydroxymethyldihydropteridine diphosphokinase
MSTLEQAFIGLGSNQGDAAGNICDAIGELQKLTANKRVICSSLYRSAPVGYLQQPDFINAVCRIDTRLSAMELLNELQSLERKAGRRRDGVRWGPRILDLDLLLFGDTVMQNDSLVLPHPRMHERAFVLYPLQEIAPNQQIPGFGPVAELVASCADQDCERIDEGC